MHPKDSDGMTNSEDSDQTAPLGAVWSGSKQFDTGAVWSGSTLFAQTCLVCLFVWFKFNDASTQLGH